MTTVGNKDTISFEIADQYDGGLLQVDIWAGGRLLTVSDNMAYVSAFIYSLNLEKEKIEKGEVDEDFIFFDHGPTTDSFSSRIKIEGPETSISFETDDEAFYVSMPLKELIDHLAEVITILTKREHIQSELDNA